MNKSILKPAGFLIGIFIGAFSLTLFLKYGIKGYIFVTFMVLALIIIIIVKEIKFALTLLFVVTLPLCYGKWIGPDGYRGVMACVYPMIYLSDFFLIFLTLIWIGEKLICYENMLPKTKFLLPAFLFVLVNALSIIDALDRTLSLIGTLVILKGFIVFIVVSTSLKSFKHIFALILALIVSSSIQSAIAIIQYGQGGTLGLEVLGEPTTIIYLGELRAAGTMFSPARFASYLVYPLLISLSVLLTNQNRRLTLFLLFCFSISLTALVLSFVRWAWITFGVSAFILFIILFYQGKRIAFTRSTTMFIGIIIVASIVSLFWFEQISYRIELLLRRKDTLALARVELIKIALNMLRTHPFLGIGANNFIPNIHAFDFGNNFPEGYKTYVHNHFALVGAETGLFGLIALCWLIIGSIRESWRVVKGVLDLRMMASALGLFATLISFPISNLMETSISPVLDIMFWLSCSMVVAIRRQQEHLTFKPLGIENE